MAKLSLKDFSGGLNTRYRPNSIADNEAQSATDLSFDGVSLRSAKGIDTKTKSGEDKKGSGHYIHKGSWLTDDTASDFEEFGDYIITTHIDSRPKVRKLPETKENTVEYLGVPRQPTAKPKGTVIKEGTDGDENVLAYPVLMLSEFDDEAAVTFNGANNVISFTTTVCTVSGTKPFDKNANVEGKDPEHYFKPKDLVTIEIPGDDGDVNIGRYIVNTVDTTNYSFFTIDLAENTPFTATTSPHINDKTLRFKVTNLLENKDTSLITDHVITAEDDAYALNTVTHGDFATYNAGLKKVTLYDASGTTLSGALTHSNNPRFFDDTLAASSDDGATFVNLVSSTLARDDILFSGSEQSFITGTRKLNSTAHQDNQFLASVTTSGKLKHDKEVVKTEVWLDKNKVYLLVDLFGKDEGFQLWEKDKKTGLKKEVTIDWRALGFAGTQGSDGHLQVQDANPYNSKRTFEQPIYWVLINNDKPDYDRFLTFNNTDGTSSWNQSYPKDRLYEVGTHKVSNTGQTPNFTVSSSGRSYPKTYTYRHKGRWTGFLNGEYVEEWWRQDYVDLRLEVGTFKFRTLYAIRNIYLEKSRWYGTQDAYNTPITFNEDMIQRIWKGPTSALTWTNHKIDHHNKSGTVVPLSNTHEFKQADSPKGGFKHSRVYTYTPHSGGNPNVRHNTSHIIDKVVVANGTTSGGVDSSTITTSSANVASKFQVGDTLLIRRSHWNTKTDIATGYKISGITGAVITVEGLLAGETSVVELDTYTVHGDAILSREEEFASHYGIIRKEGADGDYKLRGYAISNNTHATTWNAIDIDKDDLSDTKVYGITIGGTPYFVIKNTSTNDVEMTRLDDTSSGTKINVGDHKHFSVKGNYLIVSGSSVSNVLDIYSIPGGVVKYSGGEGGKGTNLGMLSSQITEQAWYDEGNDLIMVGLRDQSMLLIKPDIKNPSQTIYRAPFNYFLKYVGGTTINLYGCVKTSAGKYESIRHTRPFFESEIIEGREVHEDTSSSPHIGEVVKIFEDSSSEKGKYLLVDFNITGGHWSQPSGTLDWKFQLPGHSNSAPRIFKFKSNLLEDVVFFRDSETNIPDMGATTDNDKVFFANTYNYVSPGGDIKSYYYFVSDNKSLNIKPHVDANGGKTKFKPVKLENGDPETQTAYDGKFNTHGVGETQFYISAPNMFDQDGANVPFQYMISFVDRNGREGEPSEPSDEIYGLDQVTESIQVSMAPAFFESVEQGKHLVESMRVYRKGGNYSTYRFLFDRNIEGIIDSMEKSGGSTTFKSFSQAGASIEYVSNDLDDPINAKISVTYGANNAVNELEKYVGSDIDVSGFTNVISGTSTKVNAGLMRFVKFEKKVSVSGTDKTIIHVHALPKLTKTISAVKRSIIANNGSGTSNNESNKTITIKIDKFAFRDSRREPPVTAITPQFDASPPIVVDENGDPDKKKFFKFMKNVGGIFLSSYDSIVRFSHFNNPHSWPVLGYIELDSNVTGIAEYMGEALVFTAGNVYRVRGSNPEAMTYVKLPQSHGLTKQFERTLIEAAGRVFWMNPDGVCMYENGQITLVTFDKMGTIPNMHDPVAGYKDRVIYFFNHPDEEEDPKSRPGLKVDMTTGQPKVTRTSIEATGAIYVPEEDKLYINNSIDDAKAGVIEEGPSLPLEFKTKDFDFGDLNESTILMNLEVDIKSLDVISKKAKQVNGAQYARDYFKQKDHGNLGEEVESVIDSYGIGIDVDKPDIVSDYDFGAITEAVGTGEEGANERIIDMFDVDDLSVGMYVWGNRVEGGTTIAAINTSTKKITLSQPAISSGEDTLYFGDLPRIKVFLDGNADETDTIYPFPGTGDFESLDLYLNNYSRFRTVSLQFEGKLELRQLSINAEPLSAFKKHTLYHSADVAFSGSINLVLTIDGKDVYMRGFTADDGMEERRIYFPANSVGTVPYFKNTSHLGRISSLEFNSYPLRA